MIRNQIIAAFRYLSRHKGYTFINIAGLSVGITCCLLIMLFVKSEWSYDRFHSKADRIHRVWLDEIYEGRHFTNTVTPIPLAPALQANLPEVEAVCRVYNFNSLVKNGNNTFNESINMVDSNFFQVFDFKLKAGDMQLALANHQSVVVSENMAKKYFGKDEAIGKTIEMQLGDDKILYTVSAVAAESPKESSIRFDLLIPFSNASLIFSERTRTKAWSQVFLETYALLKSGVDTMQVAAKLPAMIKFLTGDNYKPGEYNLYFQPITDIHLNNALPAGNAPVSDPKYSYILATIGILILLIASINFVTLSIGRSSTRALEVGVRKVLGAEKIQLIRQYWGEAMLLTLISFLTGLLFAVLLVQPFNQLANRELEMRFDTITILFSIAMIAVTGAIAGIYPAFILASFAPIQVLKGRLKSVNIGLFRKGLIVAQFVASIIMIIGTFTIGRQLNYLQNKNLGYDRENIVIVPTNKNRAEGYPLAQRFTQAIQQNPEVLGTTTSVFSFAEPGWANLGYVDDKDLFRQFRMNAVDESFVPTMQLQLVAGRNFSKDNSADISNAMIVNEALVKAYGWEDPIGKKLPGRYEHQVIGVVKDFHFESLHSPIQPLVLVVRPDSMIRRSTDVSFVASPRPRITVRLKAGNVQQQLASLRTAWKSVAGDQDFEFTFLDDALNAAYEQEQRLGSMVKYASALSVFIACMGLFGLATLVVIRRTKEIGIRKVLGANVTSIVTLLSKEFVWLVAIAALIAFPAAWWALHKWLEDFAYRISVSEWIFAVAAIVALFVAIATVSIQAIRAALSNPVKSLRTE
jgi:putative ABC transport system permease protein